MVPSCVANKNIATPDLTPFETENEAVGLPMVILKTVPVGVPVAAPLGAGGITTRSPCFLPAPLYKVDSPVPLSLTQNGLPLSERVNPQPLIKSESEALVTRSVRWYCAFVTAGRTNIENAEAASKLRHFIVNFIIVFSSREISSAKHVPCDRPGIPVWQGKP